MNAPWGNKKGPGDSARTLLGYFTVAIAKRDCSLPLVPSVALPTMVSRLLFLLLLMLATSCTEDNKELLDRIEHQMQHIRSMKRGYRIMRLDSLTTFAWDRVYFFGSNDGFNTDKEISATIGFKWSGTAIPDNAHRLLFVNQGKVVAYVDCMPWDDVDGSLALPIQMYGCDKQEGYSRQEARFAVYRDCTSGLPGTLNMVQIDCIEKFRVSIKQGCTDSTLRIVDSPHLYDSTGRVYTVRP